LKAALVQAALMKKANNMDDPIYSFFHENLAVLSKEELLQALKNALESASYWREACLSGLSPAVAAGDDLCNASIQSSTRATR
jgi:hypothetical protein